MNEFINYQPNRYFYLIPWQVRRILGHSKSDQSFKASTLVNYAIY